MQAVFAGAPCNGWSKEPVDGGMDDQRADRWLNHARVCQKGVFSLEAVFVQELKHRLEPVQEKMTGKVQVRRGGRIRIEYQKPKNRLVVSDGKTVWAYDSEAKTAITGRARDFVLHRLFGFLLYEESRDGFLISHLGGGAGPEDGRGAIQLVPKSKDPMVKSVVLTLEKSCPCLKRILIEDVTGAVIRVTFDNIRINAAIGAKRFTFRPPPGTKIIRP